MPESETPAPDVSETLIRKGLIDLIMHIGFDEPVFFKAVIQC